MIRKSRHPVLLLLIVCVLPWRYLYLYTYICVSFYLQNADSLLYRALINEELPCYWHLAFFAARLKQFNVDRVASVGVDVSGLFCQVLLAFIPTFLCEKGGEPVHGINHLISLWSGNKDGSYQSLFSDCFAKRYSWLKRVPFMDIFVCRCFNNRDNISLEMRSDKSKAQKGLCAFRSRLNRAMTFQS